jgi:hypothetical protein
MSKKNNQAQFWNVKPSIHVARCECGIFITEARLEQGTCQKCGRDWRHEAGWAPNRGLEMQRREARHA